LHVLIADDDAGTRLLVGTCVERLGHRCTVAADGSEAWRLYQEETPDVVITDWEMPGMDGTALSRAIRSHAGPSYAYVIVLTGVADEEAARSTMEAGADDLLLKPPDLAQLERQLIAAGRVTALHRRLHDDARHDTLTGLGNRLRLAEDLEALSGRVERYGHSYCVALFDIDDFKGYNDGAGHLGGDGALRAVAGALQQQIRSGDAVYRYGGDEFLVLLPEQSLESARLAAERLREAVEALRLSQPRGRRRDGERRRGPAPRQGKPAGPGVRARRPGAVPRQGARPQPRGGGHRRHRRGGLVDPAGDRRRRPVDPPHAVGAPAARGGFELVGEAEDAAQAIDLAAHRRPNVVVLDFDMPGGGGVRAAVEIREASPTTRIVALSADGSQSAQYDMSRAGAVGYVVKGTPDAEIVRAIRNAARW